LLLPVTVAVKDWADPARTLAVPGAMETETFAGLMGGVALFEAVFTQPAK
jgi:hypothetical protein